MIDEIGLYRIQRKLEKDFAYVVAFFNVDFGYKRTHIAVSFEASYDDSPSVSLQFDLAEEEELYEKIKAGVRDELTYWVDVFKSFIRRNEEIGIK